MVTDFHVLTGGTSGMGLHVAKALAQLPNAHIIVGARKPDQAKALRNSVPADRLTVLPLDLDATATVRIFAETVRKVASGGQLSTVICNAGLQLAGDKVMATPDVERTFMVNVLAHVLLVDLLLPDLKSGAHVVTVGSGTHNPNDKIARLFGFRGAFFPSARRVASGDLGATGKPQQLNMDRYATSKLGSIYQALHLTSEHRGDTCAFYAFDPGLMPGTALARDRSAIERFGWTYVLPMLRHLVPGVSSSEQSAKALVRHCLLDPQHPSGSYVEFSGALAPRSELAENTANAADLMSQCRVLLENGH